MKNKRKPGSKRSWFFTSFIVLGHRGANGYIGITTLFLITAAEVIVAAVYGAGSAGALHKVMPVFGFDLVAADIAANSIFDNHCFFLLGG